MYSVVIPTYNRDADLYKCLDCLREYFERPKLKQRSFDAEVIVSDDARQKELQRYLALHYPWVRYLEGPRRGPAANRNNGASKARGEWLVFTDDDCLPCAGWLDIFHASSHKARVLEGRTNADRARERLDEESPINAGGYLWSCNFAITRALFESLGGFDENFPFAAMEDMDLKKRIDDAGEKVPFLSDAVVVHPWRRLRGLAFLNKKQRSELYFWSKHPALAPSSLPRYYAYLCIRSVLKITLPGALKYHCRGLKTAIGYDAWLLFQSLRFLVQTRADKF
jgi:GT2 family glycosyltransferase